MSDVKLTVVEGGMSPAAGACCEAEAPSVPSPEELAHIGSEGEIVEGIEEVALPSDAEYEMAVMQTVQVMQHIVRSDNALVAILVHPEAKEGFERAWQALPEGTVPQSWKEQLPIVEDPTIAGVRVLTQRDLEKQFLLQYYGPREAGGNGLIPCLEEWCDRNRCPVFAADVTFLRSRFLAELADRIFKQIHIPTGSQLVR